MDDAFIGKDELLYRLDRSYEFFDALLARALLYGADVEAPGVVGVWSLKDVLAHLIAHEQRALGELAAAKQGRRLIINHAEIDSFNAGAVAACRVMPFALVRDQWQRSFRRVVEAVTALTDADFDPRGDVVRLLDDSIDGALANNTYAHYDYHGAQIAAWLATQEP